MDSTRVLFFDLYCEGSCNAAMSNQLRHRYTEHPGFTRSLFFTPWANHQFLINSCLWKEHTDVKNNIIYISNRPAYFKVRIPNIINNLGHANLNSKWLKIESEMEPLQYWNLNPYSWKLNKKEKTYHIPLVAWSPRAWCGNHLIFRAHCAKTVGLIDSRFWIQWSLFQKLNRAKEGLFIGVTTRCRMITFVLFPYTGCLYICCVAVTEWCEDVTKSHLHYVYLFIHSKCLTSNFPHLQIYLKLRLWGYYEIWNGLQLRLLALQNVHLCRLEIWCKWVLVDCNLYTFNRFIIDHLWKRFYRSIVAVVQLVPAISILVCSFNNAALLRTDVTSGMSL